MVALTVRPRQYMSIAEVEGVEVSQTLPLSDMVCDRQRQPAKAFCTNGYCKGGDHVRRASKEFQVLGAGLRLEVNCRASATQCPACGHALFWSTRYRCMGHAVENSRGRRARKLADSHMKAWGQQ